MIVASFRRHVGLSALVCAVSLVTVSSPVTAEEPPAKTQARLDSTWKPTVVRRFGGAGNTVQEPAQLQIVHENLKRVLAVPYLVYMPEKDRLLMLVSGDYPHRVMVLMSDDHGTTWTLPRAILPHEPEHSRNMVGVSLTYLGGGSLMCGVEGKLRCISRDFGETWTSAEIPLNASGGLWNQWDPYLVDRDSTTGKVTRLMETGYEEHAGRSQAWLRTSTDAGATWNRAVKIPQWERMNEVALVRARNGHLIAACRTDIPASKKDETLDHFSGLGISNSKDDGQTWSPVSILYAWGRMHPSLVVLPDGQIVMSYVVRKGYPDLPDGFPQFGIEAVVSGDHGQTWDLDHKYLLHHWVGNRNGSNQNLPGPQAWWASCQSTSTVRLPDGKLLTAFGTGFRSQPDAQNRPAPRDVGLVQWTLSDAAIDNDRTIRDAAPDSDLRNWFDPVTGKPLAR